MIKLSNFLFIIYFVLFICCSYSGKRKPKGLPSNQSSEREYKSSKTVLKMKLENGVYKVPIEVNGVFMDFIFDTGAGMISISETEAAFLYKQGTIDESDFLGNGKFIDANGGVSENKILNLKSVRIGNKVLQNIQASIVPNSEAPLLLGQTALSQFGKIIIDYQHKVIILE
jgi:aspartyl protease family protein